MHLKRWMPFYGNPAFSTSLGTKCPLTPAIKLDLSWRLYLPWHPAHVSSKPSVCPSESLRLSPVSQTLLWALASWAIPPIDAYGWFPAPALLESHRWVTPFRVSIFRDFRTMLYAGSPCGWIPYTAGLYGPKTFPVWGLPSA